MVKRLTKLGNSLGVVIDKPILDLLKIDADTPLEITTDGDALVLRPVRVADRDQARKAARRVMDVHKKTLSKLAK
jgi:antitoxin component of MazEF toxin-antitoxin module